ncbi:MAG: hypothetical protein L6461_01960 [Anaerolineae bacterium]|nr:hypothetical protein [Anaerolineae bacterium]
MFRISFLRQNAIVQVPAALITFGLMWLLPLLVHIVPLTGPVPVGARLLPIFYAPLLAAWIFHPAVGLFASLLMPFINHAFTGMPTLPMTVLLSLELIVFSFGLLLNKKYWPRLPLAPLAFVAGKVISAILLVFVAVVPVSPWAYLVSSVQNALPGLLILLVLHLALVRLPRE